MKLKSRLAALAVMGCCTVAAHAQEGPGTKRATIYSETDRAGAIWTDEEIRSATPTEPVILKKGQLGKQRRAGAPLPIEKAEVLENPSDKGGTTRAFKFPLSTTGQLVFKKGNRSSYCSAQFIDDNIVLTAAHCVQNHKTGQPNRNILFLSQYRKGSHEGKYGVDCVATYSGSVGEGGDAFQWDYAFIKTTRPSRPGNLGYKQSWWKDYDGVTMIGYPKAMQGGEILQVVKGKSLNRPFEQKIVRGVHGVKRFTGGASGGAWIAKYSNTAARNNYVVGVNSFIYESEPGVIYSPYFDGNFTDLLNYARRGCRD